MSELTEQQIDSGTEAQPLRVRRLSAEEVKKMKREAERFVAPRVAFLDDWRRRSMHTNTIWD
jgi:hypothetical protein